MSTSIASVANPATHESLILSLPSVAQTAIAFDFGLRRIGVAVGGTLSGRAEPQGALPARDGIVNPDAIPRWQQRFGGKSLL